MIAACFTAGLNAQTKFSEGSGKYGLLLNDLKSNLYDNGMLRTVNLAGGEQRMFITWVRDHIHATKAYKYWEKDLESYIWFFMERQTPSGMYYDYWESYRNRPVGQLYFTNVFDRQFYFVDVTNLLFFFRMPIEADLEYLMVEGVYNNWQATGDTGFVRRSLPILVKGMNYLSNDPLRWSGKYQLIKRPYSIDTWDFTSEPDGLGGNERLIYHIGNDLSTPKGIMHGDNSGFYSACVQLSEMYAALGEKEESREWDYMAELIRSRLNRICWNGRYYSHFIPEDPVPAHIKTDPINSIGLSNTYSINRGAPTPEMAVSIIEYYEELYDKVKDQSKAEWFGVYPPIEPHFGRYKVGEYMNGAILPLVGGELTKAAFRNGKEEYAVELLGRLDELMNISNRKLHGCINTDGTAQTEAIPDEWGQAAFVSALVEGLAGVTDLSNRFLHAGVSPRWIFAGVDSVSVDIGYGETGKQVQYKYYHNKNKKTVNLQISGAYEKLTCRVPLPPGYEKAQATVNGKTAKIVMEKVYLSEYAVIECGRGKNIINLRYY